MRSDRSSLIAAFSSPTLVAVLGRTPRASSCAPPRRAPTPRRPLAIAAVTVLVATTACEPAPVPDDVIFTPNPVVACSPNLDGRIDAAEMPFVVGATARVRVGLGGEVDTAGAPGQGSARVWDLSRPAPEDEPIGLLTLEPLAPQWFAADFPKAEVAGPLQPGNELLGPLSIDDDGVRLWGSASKDEDPEQGVTFLRYDEPVLLYPFPLELGTEAVTETTATNALAFGLPFAVADKYTVSVTAHGKVVLPDLVLEDALRVTLRLERVPVAGFAVQQVTHVFVNECLGEVARIVSPFVALDEELPDEFPVAAEVWRLSF